MQDFTNYTAKFEKIVDPETARLRIATSKEIAKDFIAYIDYDTENAEICLAPLSDYSKYDKIKAFLVEYVAENWTVQSFQYIINEAGELEFNIPLPQENEYKIMVWNGFYPITHEIMTIDQ